MADVRTTWNLLKPHARPHVGALVALTLFGLVSALGQRSIVLLVYPAIDVLFPERRAAPASVAAPEPAPGPFAELAAWGSELGSAANRWLIGAPGNAAEQMAALGRIAV